jgi:hypothetical protein
MIKTDVTRSDQLLLYRSEDGRTRVEVRLQDENFWMTRAAMAELYQTTPQNITLHLKAIYEEGELESHATCKEFLQVQSEESREVSRNRKFYNLPAIIAVGYRVRSPRGTQFRSTSGAFSKTPEKSAKQWPINWPWNNTMSSTSTGLPRKPVKKRWPMMRN